MTDTPLPPHPKLDGYYATDADRAAFLNDMFDKGAPYYEWVCRMMSLGTGEQYRKRALRAAGLTKGMRVLDVATGTGIVLRSAAALAGSSSVAVGLDPSRGMLSECRKRCRGPLVRGRAEQLPFVSGRFDLVSMGYGLRHVADLHALFAEFRRVLRPGGRVLLLEITQPTSSLGKTLNKALLGSLIPGLARLWGGPPAAGMMDYFWDTVEHCVSPAVILGALGDAGFERPTRDVTGGVLSEYTATQPI